MAPGSAELGRTRPRVLVVDDDAGVRHLYGAFLARDGLVEVVGEAKNADEAIGLVADCRPDIILLDLTMPGRDGASALPSLRAHAPNSMIVVLSGDVVGREDELRVRGATICLEKSGDLWLALGRDIYTMWQDFKAGRLG